jgi:hypothetical protein
MECSWTQNWCCIGTLMVLAECRWVTVCNPDLTHCCPSGTWEVLSGTVGFRFKVPIHIHFSVRQLCDRLLPQGWFSPHTHTQFADRPLHAVHLSMVKTACVWGLAFWQLTELKSFIRSDIFLQSATWPIDNLLSDCPSQPSLAVGAAPLRPASIFMARSGRAPLWLWIIIC